MRIPLADLAPEWLPDGAGRAQGVSFECPEHSNCRVEMWFLAPIGGGDAVTETDARPLFQREGSDFAGLTLYPPLAHGDEALICVYEGMVNVA